MNKVVFSLAEAFKIDDMVNYILLIAMTKKLPAIYDFEFRFHLHAIEYYLLVFPYMNDVGTNQKYDMDSIPVGNE